MRDKEANRARRYGREEHPQETGAGGNSVYRRLGYGRKEHPADIGTGGRSIQRTSIWKEGASSGHRYERKEHPADIGRRVRPVSDTDVTLQRTMIIKISEDGVSLTYCAKDDVQTADIKPGY